MIGAWKKTWTVRSYPDAVIKVIKRMPQVYADGAQAGVVGWMGRTYAHQRKDFRPKPPKLSVDKGNRLVFQHDLVSPITYTVQVDQEDNQTRIQVEVKASSGGKDSSAGEQVVVIFYTLTKALEPGGE
jgi:hypothetical protein